VVRVSHDGDGKSYLLATTGREEAKLPRASGNGLFGCKGNPSKKEGSFRGEDTHSFKQSAIIEGHEEGGGIESLLQEEEGGGRRGENL